MLHWWKDFIVVRLELGLVLEELETISGMKQQQHSVPYSLTVNSMLGNIEVLFTIDLFSSPSLIASL